MSQTSSYTVTGMTCGHCVSSVTEEVKEIPGVENVDVVLETGAEPETAAHDTHAGVAPSWLTTTPPAPGCPGE